MAAVWIIIAFVVVLALFVLPAAIKVVTQYERGVVLRLGRYTGTRQPGLQVIIPYIDRMFKVDTRVMTMDVPAQEVITRDNVTVKVDAVVYLRVINADDAILKVENYARATSLISQTTLRSVLGQSELDELLSHRDKINQTLQKIVDEQTDPWGIKVDTVEVKDVELPQAMQRAMAEQTGGKPYELHEIGRLVDDIRDRPITQFSERRLPLWNTWLVLGVVLVVMLGEWLTRKLLNLQ